MNLPSALLIAMLSVGASSEAPYDTTKSGKKPDSTHTQQRGSDSLPVSVKLLNTGESKEKAAQDSARIQVERMIGVSTLRWTKVAGVSGVVLAIFAVATWWVIRRSAQRQLRAYVGVIFKGYTPATRDDPLSFHIRIKNYGQTPALNLIVESMNRSILEFPLTAVRKLIDAPDPDPHPSQSTTLHPQAKMDSTSSRHLKQLDPACVSTLSASREGQVPRHTHLCSTATGRFAIGTFLASHIGRISALCSTATLPSFPAKT